MTLIDYITVICLFTVGFKARKAYEAGNNITLICWCVVMLVLSGSIIINNQ